MLYAVKLRTEHLKDPLGIDAKHPRFGWNLMGDGRRQTAFEIRAAHSAAALYAGETVWENGITKSGSMLYHAYGGDVKSRERVYWQVRITDETGVTGPWSEPAWFETGLINRSDWEAKWICGDYTPEHGVHYPADYFRRQFEVGRVRRARMYITSCGVYETTLNGVRVGNQILTPGSTSYDTRVQYQTTPWERSSARPPSKAPGRICG